MKVILVIQARMGSTRLPGKVLKDLCGRTVLERVVERCRDIRNIDEIVVATSTNPNDAMIVDQCEVLGVSTSLGSEKDVLDRFYQTATRFDADAIVRVTCDCPLIDPGVSSQVIDLFLNENLDYASNVEPRSFPQGLDTEIVTLQALETARQNARRDYERAHVTTYIREQPDRFKSGSLTFHSDFSHLRWTLDTPDDLRLIRSIYKGLDDTSQFTWLDVLALIERKPQLVHVNQHIKQKAVKEG